MKSEQRGYIILGDSSSHSKDDSKIEVENKLLEDF